MLQHFSHFGTILLIAVSAALLLAAAATDIAFRRVPNAVSAALATSGVILRAVAGSLLAGVVAGAVVFVLATFCWRRGWLGGGDVKLLGAATLTVPPLLAPAFLLAVALAGGALAIVYLSLSVLLRRARARRRSATDLASPPDASERRRGVRQFLPRLLRVERWRIGQRGSLPYAAAIAAGALFVLIQQ